MSHTIKQGGTVLTHVATYDYKNEHGVLLSHKDRYEGVNEAGIRVKGFMQRRAGTPLGKARQGEMKGVPKVPYQLPEVLQAVRSGDVVLFVEGEKDVHTLGELGYASTTVGSSSGWDSEMSRYFEGARVMVIPDDDEPGHDHGAEVVDSLMEVAAELEVRVPTRGKDITEHLASGGTLDDLETVDPTDYVWGQELSPFDVVTEPQPFPLEALPSELEQAAHSISDSLLISPVMPAEIGLGILSGLCQRTARIQVWPGFEQQPSTYRLILAESGGSKSGVYEKLKDALVTAEKLMDEATRDERNRNRNERQRLEDLLKQSRGKLSGVKAEALDGLRAEIEGLERQLDEVGRTEPLQLWCSDVTMQGLERALCENEGRIINTDPEFKAYELINGRFADGKQDPSTLLQCFDGEALRVNRQGRDLVRIDRPALTIVATTQPAQFRELLKVPGSEERGLIARFTVCHVPQTKGRRDWRKRPEPDVALWEALVLRLSRRQSLEDCPVIKLSPEACEVFVDYLNDVIEPRRETAMENERGDVLKRLEKQRGALARLALVLHLCEHPRPETVEVQASTLERAIVIAEWELHESFRVIDQARTTKVTSVARYILRHGATGYEGNGPWAPFGKRAATDAHRGGGSNVTTEDVTRALKDLEERGYLRATNKAWTQFEWRPGLEDL